ncbi:MAG: flotillin family protein [Chloroflexota bacterium]
MSVIALAVPIIVIAFLILSGMAIIYGVNVRKVAPHEALIVSGRGDNGQGYRIVTSGRSYIWPIIERVDRLSLEIMTIDVTVADIYTPDGLALTIYGTAYVKIGNDKRAISAAAERFLSKTTAQIAEIVSEILAATIQEKAKLIAVEHLSAGLPEFDQQVKMAVTPDLSEMGLIIDSFIIKDTQETSGYLEALRRKQLAEVERDAAIREAEMRREMEMAAIETQQAQEMARYESELRVAQIKQEMLLKSKSAEQGDNDE